MKTIIIFLSIFITIILAQELNYLENDLRLSPTSKLFKNGTSNLSDNFTLLIKEAGPCGFSPEDIKPEYIFCVPLDYNRECGICYKFTNPKTGKNSFGITGNICNKPTISYEASRNMTINNTFDPELEYMYERTDYINCSFFLDYSKKRRKNNHEK